jgi:hypothetical protein
MPEPATKVLQLMLAQDGVFLRSQAITAGYGRREIDALLREGAWSIIQRGIYSTADVLAAQKTAKGGTYLLDCAARRLRLGGDSVISHESAAVLHGLPVLEPVRGPVRLTVPCTSSPTRGQFRGRYVADVPRAHRGQIAGVCVTTPARTVVDLARGLTLEAALVTADGALRMGLDRLELVDVLAACSRWPGVEQARLVALMATRWSESALESLAMVWFRRQRLPVPEQQLTVRQLGGRWLGRVDFVWREHRTVCEVDGRKKYVGAAPDGDAIARRERALWDEKVREDRIRDTGLEVVRGYWSDRSDGGAALAERIRRAFARAGAAATEGTYRIVDERDHARRGPLAA